MSTPATPDLGAFLFECEKYGPRECLLRASGGWGQVANLYLFQYPFVTMMLTVFLALGLECLFGKGFIESHRAFIWGLWIVVIFGLYTLVFVSLKNDYRYFKGGSVAAFEKGISVRIWSEDLRRHYEQISAVYFGAGRKLPKSETNNSPRPRRWLSAMPRDLAPLRIEFKDGTGVLIPFCLEHFKQPSIEKLLSHIAKKRPDLFPQISKY